MMKKIIFSFILLLVSFSSFSQSDSDFVYVTTSTDRNDYYVYIENSYGDTKEFWVKYLTPVKVVKNKKGKSIKTGGKKVMMFVNMNCWNKTYSTSNMVIYDRLGKPTSRPSYMDEISERVIPGSVMDGVYRYVCNKN